MNYKNKKQKRSILKMVVKASKKDPISDATVGDGIEQLIIKEVLDGKTRYYL